MLYDLAYSSLDKQPPVHIGKLLGADQINQRIIQQYLAVNNEPDIKKTHHFMGRFENTYIPEHKIPAIAPILEMARHFASQILSQDTTALRMGFWFNEMHKGHQTTLHTHEEDDELLSAVYYIQAPENSGDLIVYNGDESIRIPPQAGNMILFGPQVPHQVEINNSDILRLSVAINFGRQTR